MRHLAISILTFALLTTSSTAFSASPTSPSTSAARANTTDAPSTESETPEGDEFLETPTKPQASIGSSRQLREQTNFIGMAEYSHFDLIIPAKKGLSLGWVRSADKTVEFEYLKGSISAPFLIEDLGEIADTRISLMQRSFVGSNSFNLHYGITYFDLNLHLGSDILGRITNTPSFDAIRLQSLGFVLGLGNRWNFAHGITFGVDWISWAQPVYLIKKEDALTESISNAQDKDHIDTAIRIGSFFPRLAFLKLQLGMSF